MTMESFFSDSTANIVQQVSLVLEIGGLMLAFIELRYPQTARSWERRLEQTEQLFTSIGRSFLMEEMIPKKMDTASQAPPTEKQITISLNIMRGCILADVIFVIAWVLGGISFNTFLVIFIATNLPFFTALLITVFAYIVNWLNRVGNGRALGTIGIIMAGIGFAGEIYQVLVLCFSTGCYGL
ncbi:MAG: hypothetical protein V7752_08810 [Halopseudomonas sp.]